MDKIEYKENTNTTPNRRRLKIIDNTNPLDMLVDIEHLDDSKNGDMITAELLQRLEDNIYALSQKIAELEEENNAQSNLPQTGGGNGNSPKIYVNGQQTSELSFTSNPQTQIDEMKTIVNNCNTIVSQVSANYINLVTNIDELHNQIQTKLNSLTVFQNNLQNQITEYMSNLLNSDIKVNEQNAIYLGDWKISIVSDDLVFENANI